jgi:hypothetical protein
VKDEGNSSIVPALKKGGEEGFCGDAGIENA